MHGEAADPDKYAEARRCDRERACIAPTGASALLDQHRTLLDDPGMPSLVTSLLRHPEPSVRWRVRTGVLAEEPGSEPMRRLREEVRGSERARALLAGHETVRPNVYAKWQGAHWVLLSLADLGYPPAAPEVEPLVDQVLDTWLAPRFQVTLDVDRVTSTTRISGVPLVAGRARRCGSQHGGALLAVVRLGFLDNRADRLAELLMGWQWPDGGWNCDIDPAAHMSSLYETLLPMRGLAAWAAVRRSDEAAAASRRAADVLLERRLAFSRSTGQPIRAQWLSLHHPVYWHYDILAGLVGLHEAGVLDDPACLDALNLLQDKRIPSARGEAGGGWAAGSRFYKSVGPAKPYAEHVDWGPVGKRANPWVTADALTVLAAAGRLDAGDLPTEDSVEAVSTEGTVSTP
jgi:hypothetical protein